MPRKKKTSNPFAPGFGTRPAYIAGREDQREAISDILGEISGTTAKNKPKSMDVPTLVLVGPRGVGKTVLLREAEDVAERLGIHHAMLYSSTLTGPDERLAKKITPNGTIQKMADAIPIQLTLKFSDKTSLSVFRKESVNKELQELLEEKMAKKPVLLVVDEAHDIEFETLKLFCIMIQDLQSKRFPLAVVFAGTPGLENRLTGKGKTFMERAAYIDLNLLSKAQTTDAVQRGFELGIKAISKPLVKKIVEWSDCYPYFVQLLGWKVWKVAEKKNSDKIHPTDINLAIKHVDGVREKFYGRRYAELSGLSVLHEAARVAKLSKRLSGGLSSTKLQSGLLKEFKGMDAAAAKEVERKLMDLGFIYRDGALLLPGIPSFFDYVLKEIKKE